MEPIEHHELKISQAAWCFIHRLPDVFKSRKIAQGVEGMYGLEDPKTGESYVLLSQGTRDGRPLFSRDFDLSLVYPERMFVWTTNEEQETLPHEKTLEYLKLLGIRHAPGYWDRVWQWTGWTGSAGPGGGRHVLRQTLRADASVGTSWYAERHSLRGKELPKGWQLNEEHAGAWISIPVFAK